MAKLFDELMALKEAYDTKIEEEGEDALKEHFKDFFDKHPEVERVYWTQYTPYFNDGDACYFSVYEFSLDFGPGDEDEDDEDEDEEYDYEGEYNSYSFSQSEDPKLQQLGEDFSALEDIPEDVLEHVFGDHVRIVATRDGFDIHEYEHD